MKKEWLQNLKVGDEVLYTPSLNSYKRNKSLEKVGRITKTLIILENGNRFNKSTGYAPGDTWFRFGSIDKATTEDKEKIDYVKFVTGLIKEINQYGIVTVNITTLEQFKVHQKVLEEIVKLLKGE